MSNFIFRHSSRMADTVLDLSAKSTAEVGGFRHRRFSSDSPSRSPQSSPHRPLVSDGNESDVSAPSSAIKPVTGPIPTSLRDSPLSNPDLSNDRTEPPSPGTPGSSRPFKSYPMDAMSVSSMFSPTSPLLTSPTSLPPSLNGALGLSSLYDSSAFPTFPITPLTSHLLQRKRRSESRNTSQNDSASNSDSESKKLKHVPEEKKDNLYWERRRKNNEAAKRSRDTRRQKEEEIAMRAAFLEQENLKLRAQVAILKNETAKLHYMLYNRL